MALRGIGNAINHQRIISDLIFAIRKKFTRNGIVNWEVLPEISISKLDYEYAQDDSVEKDWNFDLVIVDKRANILMIVEVEGCCKSNKTAISHKMQDCLLNIGTLQEVMSIEYNDGELNFYHYVLTEKGKCKKIKTSSHCELLNMDFVRSIVSSNI